MAAPILFVTGKGGTGKTTTAIAAARALAAGGRRTLLVEPYGQSGLRAHFEDAELTHDATTVADKLSVVRLNPRRLLEEYFRDLLKLPALARRLLSSTSFNAVTSAAPGVSEFLTLDRLETWSKSRKFDRILVDGPSTGHALQLFRAPFQLSGIAAGSPLDRPLRRLTSALRRKDRVRVALVSICEEMSVSESIEARDVIADRLGIAVERPLLNRCAEHVFTQDDIEEIDDLDPAHPLVRSARLQITAQRRVTELAAVLRKGFGKRALSAHDYPGDPDPIELGQLLVRGWKL